MKIVLIEPGGYGATFQYAHNLANALAELHHEVTLTTGINFETRDFPRKYLAWQSFDRYFPRPFKLLKLAWYIFCSRPDILHIQGHLHPGTYLLIWKSLKLFCSAKMVYTAQDIIPKVLKWYHLRVLNTLYVETSHIFVNAHQNKEKLLETFPGINPNKITVIPLADLTAFVDRRSSTNLQYLPPNRKVILFFGNIEVRKGLLSLIQAFRKVCAAVPEAYLLVVGKVFSEDVSHYLQEIERLGMSHSIRLRFEYIPLKEIPELFRAADIFVAPYLHGWNSGAITTALAYGKPIVATNIGGNKEVIQNGQSGLLVPPGDIDALSDALVRVLKSDTLRAELAAGAKRQAQLNSWPEIARKTEEVYRMVLNP